MRIVSQDSHELFNYLLAILESKLNEARRKHAKSAKVCFSRLLFE